MADASDMVEGDEPTDFYDPVAVQAKSTELEIKMESDVAQARAALEHRKGVYVRVLVSGNSSPDDRAQLLKDLAAFCRYNTSTFDTDERVHCLLAGRQEAYLRINDFTNLSIDGLVEKYLNPA